MIIVFTLVVGWVLVLMCAETTSTYVRECDGKVFYPHPDKNCHVSKDGEEIKLY